MHKLASLLLIAIVSTAACRGEEDAAAPGPDTVATPPPPPPPRRTIPQVAPPLDLRKPPADATKTESGLTYKKRFDTSGAQPVRGDTVLVRYTGWRQRTGDTFFTTTGRAQPMSIDLGHAAAGFRDAVSVMHKGEKMMLWLPAGSDAPEPIAYEVELVDIVAKPDGVASMATKVPTPPNTGR